MKSIQNTGNIKQMANDKWGTFGLFGTLQKNFIQKFHNFFIFLC